MYLRTVQPQGDWVFKIELQLASRSRALWPARARIESVRAARLRPLSPSHSALRQLGRRCQPHQIRTRRTDDVLYPPRSGACLRAALSARRGDHPLYAHAAGHRTRPRTTLKASLTDGNREFCFPAPSADPQISHAAYIHPSPSPASEAYRTPSEIYGHPLLYHWARPIPTRTPFARRLLIAMGVGSYQSRTSKLTLVSCAGKLSHVIRHPKRPHWAGMLQICSCSSEHEAPPQAAHACILTQSPCSCSIPQQLKQLGSAGNVATSFLATGVCELLALAYICVATPCRVKCAQRINRNHHPCPSSRDDKPVAGTRRPPNVIKTPFSCDDTPLRL
ncbi:hypothetical protein BD309DRAFT_377782 [Dichomitus squalens]|nr:hypothetical protein BD309DRAFT_377782 [Dichomitus squalens]